MKTLLWRWGWLVLMVACSRSNDPVPNKNTNWLNACVSAEDCGAGQACLCGLCTAVCGAASACERGEVAASCVPVTDTRIGGQCTASEHGDAVAICVAECEGNADCVAVGDDLACSGAVCVQSAFAVMDGGMSVPDAAVGDAAPGDSGSVSEMPDAALADAMVDAEAPRDAQVLADGGGQPVCTPCANGWECIDGVCVQFLADEQPGIVAFARSGDWLYWVNYGSFDALDNYQHDGSIKAMPARGGNSVVLAEDRERPMGLQIDDDYAYWIDNTTPPSGESASIMRVALGGGTPETIVSEEFSGSAIAVDESYVYFSGHAMDGEVWLKRVLKDGSAEPEELVAHPRDLSNSRLLELALAGDTLYWAGNRFHVFAAPKDGSGDPRVFETGFPTPFAAEPGALYFTDWSATLAKLHVERTGEERLMLSLFASHGSEPGEASDLTIDTDHIFWAVTASGVEDPRGALLRTEQSPGDTDILWWSDFLVRPLLAIDDAYVYLAIRGAGPSDRGSVLRIAKP